MIVFGGQLQNETIVNDLLTLDLEFGEWNNLI
jgi:hypothetical protein